MILVSEWIDARGLELLEQLPYPTQYRPELWGDEAELIHALSEAQALVVRNRTRVTPEVLDRARGLKVIGRLGVGLDNIDLDACRERRIAVVYARGANAIAVVEYVLGALLYSARPWLDWTDQTKAGAWARHLGGHEVHGKTLGVVGLGDIGSRVARAARHLGMTVEAYDPHLAPFHALIADGTVIPRPTLEELLQNADVLTLHAPLRLETRHLLNHQTFSFMKPGMILINTARGGLIDESALLDALEQGLVRAAFLDVRENEPPINPDPLANCANVYPTPHLAGLTEEALARTTALVLEDVVRVLSERPPRSPVR